MQKKPEAPETFHRDSNLSRIATDSMCVGQERGTGLAALVNLGWTLQESWGAPISPCLGVWPRTARLQCYRVKKRYGCRFAGAGSFKTLRRGGAWRRSGLIRTAHSIHYVPSQEDEVSPANTLLIPK
jgi:hypothetical protein